MRALALNPRGTLNSVRGISAFRADKREFMLRASDWTIGDDWPCLAERYDQSGVANGQYFHQDLYVAQQIFAAKPRSHVDAGSRVDGFVAHVATFMDVEFLDIRPLVSSARNITFVQRNLMLEDPAFDDYTDSLSCLHTLEHFGLGRYGDPIDPEGYLRGWENLARMVRPSGIFYFSVPISRHERIEFNAHRLFGVPRLLKMIEPAFTIEATAAVGDDNELRRDLDPYTKEGTRAFDIDYGCIIFTLRKR